MSTRTPVQADADILLVEDNHGDVALVERAFETRGLPGRLHVVQTGDDAIDWVFGRGEFSDATPPDLLLLDLNLPSIGGHEVLEAMESDPVSRRIPVVVLTSSRSDDHLREAYHRRANACLIKPVDPDEFADVIEATTDFWLRAATLPSAPADDDSSD